MILIFLLSKVYHDKEWTSLFITMKFCVHGFLAECITKLFSR